MHIRCPHCRNAIEIANVDPLNDVECPSCGSHFSLVNEHSTISYHAKTMTLGQFQLLEQVGVGAFGSVWKAKDVKLDRIVAVKIPRAGQLEQGEAEQFLREARAAAQVNHPNIVSVHEVGRDDGVLYIVSDFVLGATLGEWLKANRPTPHEAAKLCVTVAEALHEAHQAGVVHRDLKPGNILIDLEGSPHLTDFGLAKRETGEVTMTVEGRILGTPAYMSPEQARGQGHDADRRSDVYSLGVVLYQMLTGELPFRGETRMLIVQILRDDPPTPRRLNQRIDRNLETVCLKCLQKSPDRRYQTALELAEDLKRWLEHKPIHARRTGSVERIARWCRRRPAIAGLLGLVAVVTVVGFSAVLWQLQQTTVARDEARENFRISEQHRQRREVNYKRALEAVDKMLTQVGAESLATDRAFDPVRKAILQDALELYQSFLDDSPDDPLLRQEVAYAYIRIGAINELLKEDETAVDAYTAAIELLELLCKESPSSSEHIRQLAGCHGDTGRLLMRLKRLPDAEIHIRRSIALMESLPTASEAPSYEVAESYAALAALLRAQERFSEAESACRTAISLFETISQDAESAALKYNNSVYLAWQYSVLAKILEADRRLEEGAEAIEHAIDVEKGLAKNSAVTYRQMPPIMHRADAENMHTPFGALARLAGELARIKRDLGDSEAAGELELASDAYRDKELESLAQLVKERPQSDGLREFYARQSQQYVRALLLTREKQALDQSPDMSKIENALDAFCVAAGTDDKLLSRMSAELRRAADEALQAQDSNRAEYLWRSGIKVRRRISDIAPDSLEYKTALAYTHVRLGNLLQYKKQDWDGADQQYTIAQQLYDAVLENDTEHPRALAGRIDLFIRWGRLARDQGDAEEAKARLASSMSFLEQAPTDLISPVDLATLRSRYVENVISLPDASTRDYAAAAEQAEKAVHDDETNATLWRHLGIVRFRLDDWQAALNSFRRSEEIAPDKTGASDLYLAMAHWKLGNADDARASYAKAIAYLGDDGAQDARTGQLRVEAAALLGIEDKQHADP